MNSKIMGLYFMPAENCVCAVSLHGNRKLLRPFKKKKNNNGTQRWHPASLREPWSTGPYWGCSFLPKEEFPVSALSSYHVRKYLVRFSPVALLRVWGLFAKPCSWLLLFWYKSKWTAHNFSSKFVIQPFIACHDLQCKVAVQNPKKPLLLCEGCCSLRS